METNYWFSEQSREDIFEILEYIAEENPSAAQRISVQLQTTCALIAEMPDIGVTVEYIRQHNIRSFHVKNFQKYMIFYKQHTEGVEILRVAHGARDLPALFNG